jgi:tRNA-binding EMAP/Myf-like protein
VSHTLLQNRKVLVMANLKARSLGGFSSQGMVLCASNDDHTIVKFVEVPEAANVGDRVVFPGVKITYTRHIESLCRYLSSTSRI